MIDERKVFRCQIDFSSTVPRRNMVLMKDWNPNLSLKSWLTQESRVVDPGKSTPSPTVVCPLLKKSQTTHTWHFLNLPIFFVADAPMNFFSSFVNNNLIQTLAEIIFALHFFCRFLGHS